EGLRQFFAPDAVIGDLSLRADSMVLPSGGASEFRTLLSGARIESLSLEGNPHKIMPAGDCAGMQVGTVRISSDDPKHATHQRWMAEWLAKWLSGGTPPAWWRRRSSWGPAAIRPHQRSAWNSLAAALTG